MNLMKQSAHHKSIALSEAGRHILDFPFKLSEIITTPGDDQEQGYAPLPFEQLLPAESKVPFDIYLKVKIKDSVQPRFVVCCPRGQVFTTEWRQKLQQARISNIYFVVADVDTVINYLKHNLEETLVSPQHSNLEKAIVTYDVLQVWTRNFFTSTPAQIKEQLKLSAKCIDSLLDLLQREDNNLGFVLDLRRHDADIYTHCLNVCLLGLSFLSFLRWSPDKTRAFGLGALLHDIGLTEIPPELLKKPGPLTPNEQELVQRHPGQGYRILKNSFMMWPDSLMMVLQHHENGDGSCYPQGLQSAYIHTWARILRILDTYEAMTAPRPWREPHTPRETLKTMCADWQKGHIYDPAYLKAFIKFLASK